MKSCLLLAAFLLSFSLKAQTKKEETTMNVAIFVYEGVELLDFGGPGEVFAATHVGQGDAMTMPFNVYTVAATLDPIVSQGFVKVQPEYTIDNCPSPDIIVLPGGDQRKSGENEKVIKWIQNGSKTSKVMMSVCTGAFLLNKAGLLDGKEATTWHGAIDRLKSNAPKTVVHTNTRFVDNGQIVTTAGVSAGIDGALHVVARLYGQEAALATAKYMEYDKWEPNKGLIVQK